ncbi:MAG: ABC transporter permease subunit [Oscillospiraceae bacterium]|nr:ABC transporter permease subunit [Oscillospiraceae bacterium]
MRRELLAYFSSPIGYIYLAVYYVFSGFYFFAGTLYANTTDLSYVFGNMFTIVLFLIPILTMRLFSEDNKHKTDQALLTAPINLSALVMGKFLAGAVVFLLGLSITLVYGVIVAVFAPPNWALIWGNFVALLLLGMALIAIGMFISSMTENQVIAAVGAFAVALGLLLFDSLQGLFSSPFWSKVVSGLSFFNRYNDFTVGIFDFSSIVFFLSVSAIFIFLTIRVLEKRRWG